MMKKSINARNRMDKRIAEKEGMLKNIEKVPTMTMNFQADYHREILQLNDLSLQLKNSRELFKSLTLSCLLYTSPSPRDLSTSRMPSSA